jgi:hypothetical protein
MMDGPWDGWMDRHMDTTNSEISVNCVWCWRSRVAFVTDSFGCFDPTSASLDRTSVVTVRGASVSSPFPTF